MKEISLTQGKIALIDDADYERVSKYRWHAVKSSHTFYAKHNIYKDRHWDILPMQNVILTPPPGLMIDHIDGNGLNNQRTNLRIVTHQQNMMNMRNRIDNISGVPGVTWHKPSGRWQVAICYMKQQYWGGYFTDLNDAIESVYKLRMKVTNHYTPKSS